MFYTAEKMKHHSGIILRDSSGRVTSRIAIGDASGIGLFPESEVSEWLVNLINSKAGNLCLTPLQHKVMHFIQAKYDVSQICPSVREIMNACGLSSVSHVHRIIEEIEEKGFVRKVPGKHRNIIILKRVKV